MAYNAFVPQNVPIRDKGHFEIATNHSSDYPGVDVEFISNKDNENIIRPRVLFEYPENGTLRILIWSNKDSEDYTYCINISEESEESK